MKYAELKKKLRSAAYWEELPGGPNPREHVWNRGAVRLLVNSTHALIHAYAQTDDKQTPLGVYQPSDADTAASLLRSFEYAC